MVIKNHIDINDCTAEGLSPSFEQWVRSTARFMAAMSRCRFCCLLLSFTLSFAQTFSQPGKLQEVHYTIDVKLDDTHHALDGVLDLKYHNVSTDTLAYLWFQLWPNAFKNDRTAYSDYLLDSGSTRFYFFNKEERGYINRLVFKSVNKVLVQEAHPRYTDIIKVYPDKPLLPGDVFTVSTPFHVQLPYNFAGFGYADHEYSFQNWYPAVALFNAGGWQPEPFVGQQQKVISEYDVSVTLPEKYVLHTNAVIIDSSFADSLKTLKYHIENVNDFVWSAERRGTKYAAPKKNFDQRIEEAMPKILSQKVVPAIGYNVYDGFQIGIAVHNFHIPENKLTYFATPMYATSSKTLTGFAGINYNVDPGNYWRKVSIGLNASRFSSLKGADSIGNKISGGFYKFAPYIKVFFPTANGHDREWIEFRTFIIGERDFDYVRYSVDSFYYPAKAKVKYRYLNQITFNRSSFRALYPYDAQLQLQQARNFYRVNAEAHYFFDYSRGGGLQARIFAAKFGYLGNAALSETYRYQPKLTAVRGEEDYTYSGTFIGRNEFDGFSSQQVMLRDGGLKLRTDAFQDLQGRSDNWVASMNYSTTLPNQIFPAWFPLRAFLDAGTYAGAWKKGSAQTRFLYVAGLQLSVFKNLLNIYAPLLYSQTFRDNLKTVPEQNTFFKKVSFSIDAGSLLARYIHKQ